MKYLVVSIIIGLMIGCNLPTVYKGGGEYDDIFIAPVNPALSFKNGGFNSLEGYVKGEYHTGIDFQGIKTTPILATATGKIVKIVKRDGITDNHNMGRVVIIQHLLLDNTKVYSLYAHLSSINNDLVEDKIIQQGTPIGYMGGSGDKENSWGTHLHFELKKEAVLENPIAHPFGIQYGYIGKISNNTALDYGYYDPADYIGSVKVKNCYPEIPLELNATKGDYSDKILLNWMNIDYVYQTRIERSTDNIKFNEIATTIDKCYIDINPPKSKLYYRIRYENDSCIGSYSKSVEGFCNNSSIAEICNLKVSNNISNFIRINWDTLAGVDGYKIYKGSDEKNIEYLKKVIGYNTNYLDDYSVSGPKTYYYIVRAYKNELEGPICLPREGFMAPKITVNPLLTKKGNTISISGTGFTLSSNVVLNLYDGDVNGNILLSKNVLTDNIGSMITDIVISEDPGTYYIDVIDEKTQNFSGKTSIVVQ
jgi:hypothetical protein